MKWLKFHITVGLLAVAALLAGCQSTPPGEQSTTAQPMPEPAVPAGYQKIAPAAIDSSAQILGQTATIFRGVLKNVQFTYDACGGPRTNYVFSDFVRGRSAGASAGHFEVLGGPTPAWVGVSELPQLALDSQYVTLLRNPDWTFSSYRRKSGIQNRDDRRPRGIGSSGPACCYGLG